MKIGSKTKRAILEEVETLMDRYEASLNRAFQLHLGKMDVTFKTTLGSDMGKTITETQISFRPQPDVKAKSGAHVVDEDQLDLFADKPKRWTYPYVSRLGPVGPFWLGFKKIRRLQ